MCDHWRVFFFSEEEKYVKQECPFAFQLISIYIIGNILFQ